MAFRRALEEALLWDRGGYAETFTTEANLFNLEECAPGGGYSDCPHQPRRLFCDAFNLNAV